MSGQEITPMHPGICAPVKAALLGLAAGLLVSGCGKSDREQSDALRRENAALRASTQTLERQQALLRDIFQRSEPGVWRIRWEGEGATVPRLVLAKKLSGEATPRSLARELDRDFAPGIEYVMVKDATVYLRIRDAEQLTQRSGSFGAETYLADATFTMTSLDGIDRIHLDFPEGDHAIPGFYSRASFLQYLGLVH
jgi:hypothetical protein